MAMAEKEPIAPNIHNAAGSILISAVIGAFLWVSRSASQDPVLSVASMGGETRECKRKPRHEGRGGSLVIG
ncbi:hypothetical protein NBRC116598_25550 [Pseudophaeobacter arcticus]|uniref:Uncharacterized protein n=1 Tax=Pseudophaeobacter arcticus TaxID=385492 RepID=A0ABQ0AMP0_9RHOB